MLLLFFTQYMYFVWQKDTKVFWNQISVSYLRLLFWSVVISQKFFELVKNNNCRRSTSNADNCSNSVSFKYIFDFLLYMNFVKIVSTVWLLKCKTLLFGSHTIRKIKQIDSNTNEKKCCDNTYHFILLVTNAITRQISNSMS